ncbi:MAG TPA: hypothetical protein VN875_06780 [Candidatus Binatus sp.]|nr:hypothetical protein [Candidatus Binatus sp.]
MNRKTLWIVLLSVCALGVAGCGSSGHLAVTMTTAPTTLAVNTGGNVVATVVHDPNAAGVTWNCTPAVACGLFSFAPDSTSSGSTAVFTAPPAIPVGGQVTITATSITNTARSASATITITASSTATDNFVFYASGEEAAGATYSVAGVVAISTDGNNTIIGGEQDYNDGVVTTSPQPSGDFITSGSLVFADDGSGNAILTLVTDNPNVGVSGTETFALSYANANHALIVQFDGSATSFGSFDLQTSAATPVSASFSFTDTGADSTGAPVADGGVFTLDSASNITGFFDSNDAGAPVLDTPIPSGVSAGPADSLGRGNVIGGLAGAVSINYYVVGPEVLRTINVDTTDTAVGSAYGQGATPAFSAESIGTSVFSVGSSLGLYAAAGQFTTDGSANFTGVADENESVLDTDPPVTGPIGGTYVMASDGYGAMNFTTALNSVTTFGIYAVDPTLNLLDPNNPLPAGEAGGALIAEMDSLVGIGALIPQTDAALGDVTSPVTFGAQGRTNTDGVGNDEFDFVGAGPFSGGLDNATGVLSDPVGALTGTAVESTNAVFNASFAADGSNPGRSTTTLVVSASNGTDFGTVDLAVTAYQANAGQLFWIETDDTSFFNGSIQANTLVDDGAKPAKPRPNAQKKR